MMNEFINPTDDRDMLYVSRKKEGRGLTRIHNCEEILIRGIED